MMTEDVALKGGVLDLEPTLPGITSHLAENLFSELSEFEKAVVSRRSVKLMWWETRLYRRSKQRLVVAVSNSEPKAMIKTLHGDLGPWDTEAT